MTSAKGGVPKILIFADRGGGRGQKGPKYTDIILEQPLTLEIFQLELPNINQSLEVSTLMLCTSQV